MRPVKLEFEGINSFSERTEIDFGELTRSGIFGIFGDTGSGKSTILDCINLALYGRVERSREKTDIINYRCNAAWVKFTFRVAEGGKEHEYTIERTIKNDKSGTHKASLCKDNACIADKAQEAEKQIKDILGVEAEDFRKCIALPQGEFSQFVKSKPAERLALIERLFNLSKYGDSLKNKITAKEHEAEEEYQNYAGRLAAYGEISAEVLGGLQSELSEGKKNLDALITRKKAQTEKYEAARVRLRNKTELERINRELEKAEAERAHVEELSKWLGLLPACRQALETRAACLERSLQIEECERKLKELGESLASAAQVRAEAEKRLEEGDYDKKIEECTRIAAVHDSCKGKPEQLKNIEEQLAKKREDYKSAERDLANLQTALRVATENTEKLKAKQADSSFERIEDIINVGYRSALLRREYGAELDYFAYLRHKLSSFDDGTPLFDFISGEVSDKINELKDKIIALKDVKALDGDEQLKALSAALEQRESAGRELRNAEIEVEKIRGKTDGKQKDLENLKRDGANLRSQADELRGELKRAFGEETTDFQRAVRENGQKLLKLREEQKIFKEKAERAENLEKDIQIKKAGAEAMLGEAKKALAQLNKNAAELLKKSGTSTWEECERAVEKYGYEGADRQVREFGGKLSALQTQKAELEKACTGDITAEAVESERLLLENIEEELKKLTGENAVHESRIKEITAKLKEKEEIEKQAAQCAARKSLIQKLKEATRNNKFLEYVADEYLCDISVLASSTLLNLTDGRYFLRYTENNFFVGDNYNCGNPRGVNTLSGGETFLVSLSLALALSQTICARSLKSIEFFFLDEGFGTLDSALVDTVMNALEKLKSERFTIGVISHVEELKHRIESKIIVNKATESHGSTVSISC